MLGASARSLSADLFGAAVARGALAGDRSGADKGWAELQAAGLTGLLIPAELGGGGGSLLDACVVLSELAAALAPVPYLTSAVAVPSVLLACAGSAAEGRLRALADGETLGLVVDSELRWPPESPGGICLDWQAGRAGLAIVGGAPIAVDKISAGASVDPLHPLGTVTGSGGALRSFVDVEFADGESARRALAAIRVAAAAALTGCLAGAAQLAWDYVKTREQYGHPLASFQAVRHLAADLLVDLELCRSVSYGAAWIVDNEDVDSAEQSAAIAKAWCGQAAVRSVETAIQLLGGIGVTWESSAHLYLRNANLLSALFGDTRALLRGLGSDFIELRGKGNDGPA